MLIFQVILVVQLSVLCIASPTTDDISNSTTTARTHNDISIRSIKRAVNEAVGIAMVEHIEPLQRSMNLLVRTVIDLQSTAIKKSDLEASVERTLRDFKQSLGQMQCGFGNGYDFWAETGHCYKLHKANVNWSAADETCRREGSLLAVVNSRAEARYLGDLENGAFIGVHRDSDDHWLTVTGEDVVAAAGYYAWHSSAPEPEYKWRYGIIYSDDGGRIGTASVNSTGAFICEKMA